MRKTLIHILLLALSYAVVGRLFVLLAIPPGYATAIFPSAGLAIVAVILFGLRIVPGVFFGSLLLNLWIGFDNATPFTDVLPIAIGVATGATLQTMLALALVHYFVRMPKELTRDTDIIKFLILAGPVACTINASFGIGSLYLNDALAADAISYSWFTWWVGDSLGVLVGAPLVFILLAPAVGMWRKRRFSVGLPLVIMSAGLIWLFVTFSAWEVRQREFQFNEKVQLSQEKLVSRLELNSVALGAFERFFSYSSRVTREEFQGYAGFFLEQDKDIRALSWNRYVKHSERAAFESELQQSVGVPHIFNLGNDKATPAAEAGHYVVVEYIEPATINGAIIGLNVLANPARERALWQARDSAKVTASSRIILAQTGEAGVLVFHPVYNGRHQTLAQRRESLLGFVTGVIALKPLLDSVLATSEATGLELSLTDISDTPTLLYQSAPIPDMASHQLTENIRLQYGGRDWQLTYWLAADHVFANSDFLAFGVLAIGLLFTGILGAFLLVVTGRAHHINQLVAQRSAELKGVLDNALDTILTFDTKGVVTSINPAGEQLLHRSRNDILSQPVQRILPELKHETYLNAADDAPVNARFDTVAVRADGVIIPVELALSKMEINGAEYFTVIMHDLIERNKAETLKDDIISTVSHELRTPLTSIVGSLSLVNSGVIGSLPEKASKLISLAEQNAQRLTTLINDILELSKHQADNFSLDLAPLPLAHFLSSAIDLNAGYASQYRVKLYLEPVEPSLTVLADEAKLMQVFSNLLSNAIKYSPTDGTVSIKCNLHDVKSVDIAVTDHGNGIPNEFHQFVFRRFSQADSTDTRRVGGSGLGLSIAKIIVDKHQGEIWFDTEQGKGTTFYVRLPLSMAPGEDGGQF